MTYYYEVTNTGSTALSNVGVTDSMSGLSAVVCPSATLAAGASEQCSATYTTTQADLDAGGISNTATAKGTPPSGPCVSATSSLTIPAKAAPSITVVKSASVTSFSAAGTPVTYYYEVTNSGDVTLHQVGVTDPMSGLSSVLCPSATLAPGASETCSATYTTTAGDVTNGSIKNTGTATGTYCSTTVTDTSSLTIPYVAAVTPTPSPAISIVKSASVSSYAASGTLVTYYYKVTNTGNVTLHKVGVTDPMTGLSAVVCPDSTLAAGASETCSATYTTTAGDVTNGSIENTGTASGTYCSTTVTASSSLTIPYVAATPPPGPAISIVKSASVSSYAASGTLVTYYYKVTNTGTVTLTSVGVTDPMTGLSAVVCPDSTLAMGASETCSATYTTTTADVTSGSISNTGTASGTPPTGPPVTATSSLTIPYQASVTPPTSSISVDKTASVSTFSGAGTLVTYYYKVTNTGTTTLTSVGVTDPMTGLSAVVCPDSTLAAGASETCSATYTTTAADVDSRSISNTGTASGTPPTGPPVTATSSLTIPYLSPIIVVSPPAPPLPASSPAISLVKTAGSSTYETVGQVVTYTYVITNTGNVSLPSSQYTVSDNKIGAGAAFDCGAAQTLAVGASITCTNTYTITAADLTSGSVTNQATATNGSQTSPVATATITGIASTTTTIPTSPSKPPPAKIPSSAPSTGAGGEAKGAHRERPLVLGAALVLAGFAIAGIMLRRRRV